MGQGSAQDCCDRQVWIDCNHLKLLNLISTVIMIGIIRQEGGQTSKGNTDDKKAMTCKPSTLDEAAKKPPRIEMPSKWNPRLSDLPENEMETEEKDTAGEAKADSARNGEVSTKEVVSTVANKTATKMKWKKAIEKQNYRNGYKPIMTDQGFVKKDDEEGKNRTCKDLITSGPVELVKVPDANALSKKVASTVSKKTASKMKWKKAIEKQNDRNGYKPIMTDHGFVTKDLRPPQNNKKKENEITKQHVSECNRLSENTKIDNSACIQNGNNTDQEKKRELPERSKEEKEEKKLREGEVSNGTAQRPSSLNIRSHLRKEQQGRQDDQQQGSQQQQHNQGTQEDLRKEQQGTQEDLVSTSDHKKEDQDGCSIENEKQSQEPKQSELSGVVLPAQGWTSWQEMAAKKCPTKNLIVFN